MKDWCKHRYGFVNFDDEFMYFTSSGNWSHVSDLGEFNEESTRKSSSAERYKTISYLGVVSVALICLFWWFGIQSMSFSAIIGISWLAYAAYHYMKGGLTGEFKVPYSKIQSIEVGEQTVDISFTDFNGKVEKQHLQGLYSKGIDLFHEISDNYLSKSSEMEESDPTNWEV